MNNSNVITASRHPTWNAFKDFVNRWWILEIFASLATFALLAVVFAIMILSDKIIVENWPMPWSVNSVVGFIATIIQVAMMVTVTASISELKWIWFRSQRKLKDIDSYDEASRSPFGALLFFKDVGFLHLASFGAFITVATLAFHTLMQNAISTRGQEINMGIESFYPQGNNYSGYAAYSTGTTIGDQGPPIDMVAALEYAMFYSVANRDIQNEILPVGCLTGNCTWGHIQSLGISSKCVDTTSQIQTIGDYYRLPSGVQLDTSVGLVTAQGFTTYPNPNVLPDIGPLIVYFSVLARSSVDDAPTGVDCAMYWSIFDSFNVSVTNYTIWEAGRAQVWTDLSSAAMTTYHQKDDIVLTPLNCWDDEGHNIPVANCTKIIGNIAQTGLQNFFIGDLTGFTGTVEKNITYNGWSVSSDVMELLYHQTGTGDILGAYANITNNIAIEMRNYILQGSTSYAVGTSWSWMTVYHIRWGYMAGPSLLVVLSALFLLITMVRSIRHEKWKSSALPLLYHGMTVMPHEQPENLVAMQLVADRTMVQLERIDNISKLVVV